jgi:hypothetical protein
VRTKKAGEAKEYMPVLWKVRFYFKSERKTSEFVVSLRSLLGGLLSGLMILRASMNDD